MITKGDKVNRWQDILKHKMINVYVCLPGSRGGRNRLCWRSHRKWVNKLMDFDWLSVWTVKTHPVLSLWAGQHVTTSTSHEQLHVCPCLSAFINQQLTPFSISSQTQCSISVNATCHVTVVHQMPEWTSPCRCVCLYVCVCVFSSALLCINSIDCVMEGEESLFVDSLLPVRPDVYLVS